MYEWTAFVIPTGDTGLKESTKTSLKMNGMVLLHVKMIDLTAIAWFGIVGNMAVHLLLGKYLIDKHIQGIFPRERKIVPNHSSAV